MLAKLRAALAALEREDHGAARDALVAAWRSRRSPVLAELVDVLDAKAPDAISAQLAQIITPRVLTTFANVRKLDKLDDPRLATWTLEALANPPFCAPTAKDFLVYLAATIKRLRDPRLQAELPEIRAVLVARVTRKPMYTKTVRALEAAVARGLAPRKATAEELAVERAIEALVAPLRRPGRTVESLLAEVYAHPDDDAPRMVLADLLLERGDPHGEFITLQLARGRTGEPSEREVELLKRHGKKWLGNLAPVISFGKGYSSTTFVRGFLAVADFIYKVEKKLKLVASDPAWATVEELHGPWERSLLETAPLTALRSVTIDDRTREALESRALPFPSATHVELAKGVRVSPELLRRLFPAVAKLELGELPELARLGDYGVAEIAIDLYCGPERAAVERAHEAFVAQLATATPTVERISIRAPWSSYPGPKPVHYRRAATGYVPA